MCCDERNTLSRGRSVAVVLMRWRTRAWRRAKSCFDLLVIAPFLLLLAFLAPHRLLRVFDALALVGLRLAVGADDGGDLPDTLLVRAGDGDERRLLADDLHVFRDRKGHVVAVAQLQHQVLALDRGAVADAIDLEIGVEALGDAGHHVVDERPRRAPQHARAFAVAARRHHDFAVLDRRLDIVADGECQGAEPAFGGQHRARQIDADALRHGDRILADARHDATSEDAAQDLAADIGGAGLVVRHDAARRRENGDAESVIDARQVGDARVDAPARLRHPGDLLDDRLAIGIFELDLELGNAGTHLLARVAADIAFPLQHFENIGADLRGRRLDHRLLRALAVLDPGQHVPEGIAHRHAAISLTSST